jgi:tetratricopeptide (TPR) repeat protein
VLLFPAVMRIATARAENRRHAVAAGDLLQPLYRDLAAVLRESQPQGEIILLANPNASAGIGYFGRFQSLGTLYWENAPGLRAAAEIFSAPTDEAALTLIRARNVSHVALLSTANFLGEYYQLLHPNARVSDAKKTFGYRLLEGQQPPPRWLQAIPYRPPADLKDATRTLRLFKVAPDQTPLEHLYHFALAQLAAGDVSAAEKSFEAASALVPAQSRAEFHETAGAALYDYGADAAAVRQFRRVLSLASDPNVANTVAWILATTRDDTLRDGGAALALAEPIVRQNANDPTALSTYAAACAEVGRFADAVSAAERALATVRASGDRAAAGLLARRLDSYRANRPWRQ